MLNKAAFEDAFSDNESSSEPYAGLNDLTGALSLFKREKVDVELDENEAFRTKENKPNEMEWGTWHSALEQAIRSLNGLTKTRIQHFFPTQYASVMDTLRRAFFQSENNSLLLLARSKQTLSALTRQVENDIRQEMEEKTNDPDNIKVIKVNSTLNNSENKIQTKFCEAFGIKGIVTGDEMYATVTQYFIDSPDMSILFIFEDIDNYVETTRQVMLYKILDMLT